MNDVNKSTGRFGFPYPVVSIRGGADGKLTALFSNVLDDTIELTEGRSHL